MGQRKGERGKTYAAEMQRVEIAIDASEANLEVLEHQLKTAEPMTDQEKAISISCDNTGEIDIDGLVKHIRTLARASGYGKTDGQ